MMRFYPLGPLLAGLAVAQAVAVPLLYFSNQELYALTQALEAAGFLVVPNRHVQPELLSWGFAFWGGLFFTFSLGTGLTVLSLAAGWVWARWLKRRRVFTVLAGLAWGAALLLVNARGTDPLITGLIVLVCPITAFLAVRGLPPRGIRPGRAGLAFILPLLIVGGGWATQIDEQVFQDLRDALMWSNPVGRHLNEFYYHYTLAPAEVFKNLRQKTWRICRYAPPGAVPRAEAVKKALLKYDFLPLNYQESVDLELSQSGEELTFRDQGQLILQASVTEFLDDPDGVLGRFALATDRHRLFRRATYLSLLAGLPLGLYLLFFGVYRGAFFGFLGPEGSAWAAGAVCLVVGLGLLWPIWWVRSVGPGDVAALLRADSWPARVAGLKEIETRHQEIHGHDYRHLLTSPLLPDRYWLAVALAESRRPETMPDVVQLLSDPEPNVACMAFRALGVRRDRAAVPLILARIKESRDWYVQWYAYRALKELGWSQGSS